MVVVISESFVANFIGQSLHGNLSGQMALPLGHNDTLSDGGSEC